MILFTKKTKAFGSGWSYPVDTSTQGLEVVNTPSAPVFFFVQATEACVVELSLYTSDVADLDSAHIVFQTGILNIQHREPIFFRLPVGSYKQYLAVYYGYLSDMSQAHIFAGLSDKTNINFLLLKGTP